MIASSVANNLGLNARQLHLIPVENCADCWFVGFRLQAATTTAVRRRLQEYQKPTSLLKIPFNIGGLARNLSGRECEHRVRP